MIRNLWNRKQLAFTAAIVLAMMLAIVCAGAKRDAEICGRFPITIVTAIVSPKARPRPSTQAPAGMGATKRVRM